MHMHMQHSEIKSLPVRYRKWFINRLIQHFNKLNDKTKAQDSKVDARDKLAQFEEQIKKKLS